jgi:hypothetical protein
MADEVVSPLRRRMIEDMSIRKLAPKTQQGYIRIIKNLAKRTCISRRSAGPFKQTVVASRQSKVDWRAAAQSREALRSSSRQRLALMAWRLCRSHRRR